MIYSLCPPKKCLSRQPFSRIYQAELFHVGSTIGVHQVISLKRDIRTHIQTKTLFLHVGTDEAVHLLSNPAVKDEQEEGKTLSNSPQCPKVIRYVTDVVNLCSNGGLKPGQECSPTALCTRLSAVNPEASSLNCT